MEASHGHAAGLGSRLDLQVAKPHLGPSGRHADEDRLARAAGKLAGARGRMPERLDIPNDMVRGQERQHGAHGRHESPGIKPREHVGQATERVAFGGFHQDPRVWHANLRLANRVGHVRAGRDVDMVGGGQQAGVTHGVGEQRWPRPEAQQGLRAGWR